MEKAISTITVMPYSKAERKDYVNTVISELKAGFIEEKDFILKLQSAIKTMEEIKSHPEVRDLIRESVKKENSEKYDISVGKIELAEVGIKYDYSNCNDIEIEELFKAQKEINKKLKERQNFLKAVKGDVYGSDGVQLFPPSKESTSSFKVTLK